MPPMAMARAFSVFANGGYLIDPFVIKTIKNQSGEIVYQNPEIVLCDDCQPKEEEVEEEEEDFDDYRGYIQ